MSQNNIPCRIPAITWSNDENMTKVEKMFQTGIQYSIYLLKKGLPVDFTDEILPLIPPRVMAMTWDRFVYEQLNLCCAADECPMASHCHVLAWIPGEEYNAIKLCPVLFHDLVKPKWKLKDIL